MHYVGHIHLKVTDELSKKFIQMPVGELVDLDAIKTLAKLFEFLHRNAARISEVFGYR